MPANSIMKAPYTVLEEWLNSLSHGVGFVIAIVGTVFLLLRADTVLAASVSAIYGGSLMLMFLSSTLYHGIPSPKVKAVLKVIDHSAIYLLIAGTYTPFLMISLEGMLGWISTIVIWSIAIFGVGFKYFSRGAHPRISVTTYLVMGWLALVLIYPLYQALPAKGFWLLLLGGLCFSVGVLFYVAKQIKYTHAVWHLWVVAGCLCHFMSIYHYVI